MCNVCLQDSEAIPRQSTPQETAGEAALRCGQFTHQLHDKLYKALTDAGPDSRRIKSQLYWAQSSAALALN